MSENIKVWTGKLKLNGERRKEGAEVDARIVVAASVLFEVSEDNGAHWRTADADEIHAASWLRALGETGQAIGLPAKGAA